MTGDPNDLYVIWSIEHDRWWRPGRLGYCDYIDQAGRYTHREAEAIVRDANLVAFHECMIPLSAVSSTRATDEDVKRFEV